MGFLGVLAARLARLGVPAKSGEAVEECAHDVASAKKDVTYPALLRFCASILWLLALQNFVADSKSMRQFLEELRLFV